MQYITTDVLIKDVNWSDIGTERIENKFRSRRGTKNQIEYH